MWAIFKTHLFFLLPVNMWNCKLFKIIVAITPARLFWFLCGRKANWYVALSNRGALIQFVNTCCNTCGDINMCAM